eukprot:1499783-Pyramimonas_sp.AAC.1
MDEDDIAGFGQITSLCSSTVSAPFANPKNLYCMPTAGSRGSLPHPLPRVSGPQHLRPHPVWRACAAVHVRPSGGARMPVVRAAPPATWRGFTHP